MEMTHLIDTYKQNFRSYAGILINNNTIKRRHLQHHMTWVLRQSLTDSRFSIRFFDKFVVFKYINNDALDEITGLMGFHYFNSEDYWPLLRTQRLKAIYDGHLAREDIYIDYYTKLLQIVCLVFIPELAKTIISHCS